MVCLLRLAADCSARWNAKPHLHGKNGGNLVQGFHRGIAGAAFDSVQRLDADSAVLGELWLRELAHFAHGNYGLCNRQLAVSNGCIKLVAALHLRIN
jgi:hypothetical protein